MRRTVPAAPVAAHIEALMASGWRQSEIAREVQVSTQLLYDVRHGQRTVGVWAADQILALEVLPNFGRLLRTLRRRGWTVTEIADEIGYNPKTLWCSNRRGRKPSRDLLLALDQLVRDTAPVTLLAAPLVAHLRYRMAAQGVSAKSLGHTDRRYWHRMCQPGARIPEATADAWAIRFGLLLEEVYGPNYDEEAA